MADVLGLAVRFALATAVDSVISFRKEKITFQRGPNQELLCSLPRNPPLPRSIPLDSCRGVPCTIPDRQPKTCPSAPVSSIGFAWLSFLHTCWVARAVAYGLRLPAILLGYCIQYSVCVGILQSSVSHDGWVAAIIGRSSAMCVRSSQPSICFRRLHFPLNML